MNFSPELMRQLLATFEGELSEGANTLINGLVELEQQANNPGERQIIIEKVFRTAHNLKGAASGLGIVTVSEIAHNIETIFSEFKTTNQAIPKKTIDICLDAVDKMQSAMRSFMDNAPLDFDAVDLKRRMNTCQSADTSVPAATDIPEMPKSAPKPPQAKKTSSQASETPLGGDSIRVPLKVIDRLSELAEEIQSSKIQMEDNSQHAKHLSRLFEGFSDSWKEIRNLMSGGQIDKFLLQKSFNRANDDLMNIATAVNRMSIESSSQANDYSRLSRSVHEEVAVLRLVPANNFLGLLPRVIRDLAADLKKQVELKISGGEVHIDKYVLEGLKDPINHILRNAIDHGIESEAVRKAAGKPEVGTITISVREAGGKVNFEISDDGAGLDLERIKSKIKSYKPELADKLSTMSEEEIQQFIFHSGFSTKTEVTSISGRGVGMDVVNKNVQALKGNVSIRSKKGVGTTFILCVPLSLSSERGLIVRSEDQIFVLPTASINRVHVVPRNEIVNLEGQSAVLIDHHPVLLKQLSMVLGINQNNYQADTLTAVILKIADNLIALTIDEILGERDIVIKSIHDPLSGIACISGATLLDRNKIAIVLNPVELMKMSLHSAISYAAAVEQVVKPEKSAIRILVVDDSITTRTLEKNILESKNYDVTTAVNGRDAWDILQKQSFSLMITDISMPVMDGFELTERVKKNDKLAQMPVIIITSLGSDAEKARGIEVGADAYIVKSEFESGALLQMIEQLV